MPFPTQPQTPPSSGGTGGGAPAPLEIVNTRTTDGALGYIDDFMREARGLAGQVESRRSSSMGFLRDAIGRADQPTLTRDAIGNLFSRMSDDNSQQARSRARAFGDSFAAGGGIGGGAMAKFLSQNDYNRMALRQGGMRDITIAKAQSDSQDRARRWGMDVELAGVMNQSPSLLGIDALGQSMAFMEARQQSRDSLAAASMSANAQRSAGRDSKAGGIAGGVLSLGAAAI